HHRPRPHPPPPPPPPPPERTGVPGPRPNARSPRLCISLSEQFRTLLLFFLSENPETVGTESAPFYPFRRFLGIMAVFVEKHRGWPLDNAVEEPPAPEPVEDSGAETYSRYRWQARAAVIDALRMVARDVEDERAGREPPERRIVCERFEDWVVFDGGNREFVSAKHRELRRGPWTFSTVVD